MDRTPVSRELRARFEGSGRFRGGGDCRLTRTRCSVCSTRASAGCGPRAAGLRARLQRGQTAQVQVLVDGTNSNTASLVSSYASQVIGAYCGERTRDQQNVRLLARAPTGR